MPRFNFEASYGAGYYPEVKRLTLPEMQLVGFTRRLDFASEQELEYSSCMAMKDGFSTTSSRGCTSTVGGFTASTPHAGEGDELSSTLVMAVDSEHKRYSFQPSDRHLSSAEPRIYLHQT